MKKKLYKSNKNKMLAGVCGGLAEYFNIDPTIVRIIAVILGLINGIGFIAYLIIAIVMPQQDLENCDEEDVEKMKSAKVDSESSENDNSSTNNSNKDAHTDSEFDSYFKK